MYSNHIYLLCHNKPQFQVDGRFIIRFYNIILLNTCIYFFILLLLTITTWRLKHRLSIGGCLIYVITYQENCYCSGYTNIFVIYNLLLLTKI